MAVFIDVAYLGQLKISIAKPSLFSRKDKAEQRRLHLIFQFIAYIMTIPFLQNIKLLVNKCQLPKQASKDSPC
ncbi:hypothetical protein T4D_15468 [Trichinella pseudospiralis]|uniref:Uncharacterized protein n=1 Tax=Trichinella pseudospiralis TaxID=6337 RepID=A0A0V1FKZ4_TRIPS|nr:hypothetical protein T4D_15468 [Trichinella pseudospiralis]